MKKIISFVLCLATILCMCVPAFAQEAIGFYEGADNVATDAVLLDEVYFALDEQGNIKEINPKEKGWVADHVVIGFHFYDTGIRDEKHQYEVHMSATVDDSYYYFTKHIMQIRPTGNSDWFKHTITHNTVDHKLIIGDSMGYYYKVGSEPSNPKVDVKCSFDVQNYGSFSVPQFTLSSPTEL